MCLGVQVRSDMTVISAADSTGLLFGVYTFMQLLQLHSEVLQVMYVLCVYVCMYKCMYVECKYE